MIESIEITNFKSIRHEKIDLERLTVFVGANASGKTSVLEAIEAGVELSHLPDSQTPRIFSEKDWADSRYTVGGEGRMSFVVRLGDGQQISVSVKSASTTDATGDDHPELSMFGVGSVRVEGRAVWSRSRGDSLRRLQLSPKEMALASYAEASSPVMSVTGLGFASYLAQIALNDPDRFEEIGSELRRLIPHFLRVRFTRVPVLITETEILRIGDERIPRTLEKSYPGNFMLFDFVNAKDVSAHLVSEGTLILLGLLTQILAPDRPRVLLLDDIDRGLHPLAQRQLIEALRRFMERFPDLQIIATSHSPYLLDCLHHNEVRLMSLDAEGYSTCKMLSQHPDFEQWRDEMAPGEMWSLFGEKWLAEGAPAQ